MIGIYKITNLINGKCYIGQSVHIERRWQEHKQPSATSIIAQAIKTYGIKNFSFEVLEETTVKDLDEREGYYIQLFNSIIPNGYNIVEFTEAQHTSFGTFDKETYYQIVDKIRNTNLTFDEIAQEFNLCKRTITRINNGYTHRMEDVEYPIRQTKFETKEWVCIDCGKPISKGAMRCNSCQRIASRVYKRPTREELKNLIRSLPITKVGEKFNVTDNTIRKWCDSYDLPRKKIEINKYSDIEWEKV